MEKCTPDHCPYARTAVENTSSETCLVHWDECEAIQMIVEDMISMPDFSQ